MQTQPIPILIFAQSGRFLAQSASQAGYTIWVADCYGDTDLLAVADRHLLLPAFTELTQPLFLAALSELTRGEHCLLICGSGIEYYYPLLFSLPANIQLIGNTADAIHAIKTPALFFDLLDQHGFNYPETQFEIPSDDGWLIKPAQGLGGTHIHFLALDSDKINSDAYYQRFISGNNGSCLFLADGQHAHIISINQQFLAADNQYPFQLGRIESAWPLSASQRFFLHNVVNQLTASVNLVGLNSLDFIITQQDKLLILEINPRVSASAELINNKAVLFQQHINACFGRLPSSQSLQKANKTSLFYHFAQSNFIVPDNMWWPTQCSDLPIGGAIIKQGEPICTSIVEPDKNNDATQLHLLIEQNILKQLIPTT